MELAGPCVIQSGDKDLANRWLGASQAADPILAELRAVAQPGDVWVVSPLLDPLSVRIIHQRSGFCLARSARNFEVCVIEPITLEEREIPRQVWTLNRSAPGTYTLSSLMDDKGFVTPGKPPYPQPQFGVKVLPGDPGHWIFVQIRA